MSSDPHSNDFVTIQVNGRAVSIHRGNQAVEVIKVAAGVPLSDELSLVVNEATGELRPLPNNGHVVIKPGMLFVAVAPVGTSA